MQHLYIQAMVRFYADYRIKQHASLRLLRGRLIFLFSLLQVYSQGGMVNVFTSLGVLGYLILFPAPTFVSQRQSLNGKSPSLLVFPLIFTDLILSLDDTNNKLCTTWVNFRPNVANPSFKLAIDRRLGRPLPYQLPIQDK
ncbi:hypothetical protein AG1IA_08127 [Rhizoctonia solani AG-1 IA]|uniref:Uncharacterized protein n=1 Tax=Thanatephorus cucumeris (strain AG1-IA) TaxID=983506 RepID=L8WI23_THACA|nr:hypothetical protein AG1IA_08127 [Rhizoctonia solani AG-1 IA]